jgi:uncharacterized repeat protein (TIGR02059 family)
MRRRLGQITATLLLATLVLALLNMSTSPRWAKAQPAGSLETTFNTAVGTAFAAVTSLATDSSGNIYVGYSQSVKKISSTGALTWTSNVSLETYSIAIDNQSRVLVGTRGGLRRISSAGTADSTDITFNSNSGATNPRVGVAGANAEIYSVAYQATPDRVLFLSNFYNSARRLGGLTNTGVEDSLFTQSSLSTTSAAMALDSSNNIYVVGPSGMGYLQRFSATGTTTTAETTFASNVSGKFDAAPTAIAVDSSNNVYVVGSFTGRVKKFSASGVEDTSFNTNATAAALPTGALTVAVQADGKVVVGGSFTGNLKRFNTDGTLDTAFVYNNSTGGTVNEAIILNDGYILVGTASTPFIKKVYSIAVAPNTPGTPVAVAGDSSATVTVTAASGGVMPTRYTVTAVQDSSKTCTVTGTSGSCVVTGLTNGTSYTFTSTAHDADSMSASSAASNAVIPVANPLFSSATVNSAGNSLILTYNKELSTTTATTSAFEVYVGSVLTPVSSVQVSGSTVSLSITPTIGIGQVVTVKYTAPTASDATTNNAIQNLLGNDALGLSTTTVTNNSTTDITAPVFGSATTSTVGDKITLTYNEALNATTATTGMFDVRADGNLVTVTSATVSGSTVLLNLNPLINEGQVVTVTYSAPSTVSIAPTNNAIQDTTGNDAITVTSASVSNISIKSLTCATNKGTGGTGGSTRSATEGGNGCVLVSYGSTTEQFSYVGEPYTWTVPVGTTSVTFKAYGAGGGGTTTGGDLGSATAYNGGNGGYVEKTYSVTPGQSFTIKVGAGGIGNLVTKGTLTYGVTYAYTNSGSGLVDLASGGTFPVGAQVTLSGLGTAFDGVKTVTSVSGIRISFTNSFTD